MTLESEHVELVGLANNRIKISVPACLENLSLVRSTAKAFFNHEHVGEKDIFMLLSVIDELATNVVEHGYKGERGDIIIEIQRSDKKLCIMVKDHGSGFVEQDTNKEEGGMGLIITKSIADDFTMENHSDGTTFHIVKNIEEVV